LPLKVFVIHCSGSAFAQDDGTNEEGENPAVVGVLHQQTNAMTWKAH